MAVELIEHNPSFKLPAMLLLEICNQEKINTRADAENAAAEKWDAEWRQNPASIMDVLISGKAIEERLTVDGEPYEGTLEDIQLDFAVDEDADVVSSIAVTKLGERILAEYAPEHTLAALFDEKPQYEDVFKAALEACDAANGCSRVALEDALESMEQLQPDPETHQTKVYAQYFIDALETAGAIRWDGVWRLTDAGQKALAA